MCRLEVRYDASPEGQEVLAAIFVLKNAIVEAKTYNKAREIMEVAKAL